MPSVEEQRLERLQRTVNALARRTCRKYKEVSFDDLVGVGHEAALYASRSFDPAREVPFEMFALKRIRGAMIRYANGEAFGLAPLQKAIHKRLVDGDAAPPGDVPLEVAMADTPETIRKRTVAWARKQAIAMAVTALVQEATHQPDQLERRDAYRKAHTILEALLQRLPEDERVLIDLHYRSGGTLSDVAERLGVSVRTVKRLHEKVKDRLAKQMRRAGVDEAPEPASSRG